MKSILAFFGAFNPPTVAHLKLARCAQLQTHSDGVVFVPSKSAYIKNEQCKDYAFSDKQRLDMLSAVAEARPWMTVTDFEILSETQPRTYTTLCYFKTLGYSVKLLIGADKLPELEKGWRFVDNIAKEFGIVCLARGDSNCEQLISGDPYLKSLSPYITVVNGPQDMRGISSTAVRKCIDERNYQDLTNMVPKEILQYLMHD